MSDNWLTRAERASRSVSEVAAFVGVVGMLIIGTLTVIDVFILRTIMNRPIAGSNEFLSTIFAIAIAAVLASGLAQRATLEVDFLRKIVGRKACAWMRLFGHALFLLLLVAVGWEVIVYTISATRMGQVSVILQWPMWPFLIGISCFFVLCVPVQLIVVLVMTVEAMNMASVQGSDQAELPVSGSGSVPSLMQSGALPFWPVIWRATAVLVAVLVMLACIYAGSLWWQEVFQSYSVLFTVLMLGVLWILILLFVPVAAALLLCAIVGMGVLMDYSIAFQVLGSETVGLITNQDLGVLPLFMMMGAFAGVSGLSFDLYRLAHATFRPFSGGLALATIGGCAGFGSLTGSSLATVATIGSVALPEMRARGYSVELSCGSVAAGGTLGLLIPPSTAAILYAILVEESIGQLYIAILVPAALTILLYSLLIIGQAKLMPSSAPGKEPFDRKEFFDSLRRCGSAFFMFAVVIGGMFFGVFTATEAGAVGVVIAFTIALVRGKLTRRSLWQVIGETTQSTSMLYFVIIGAMTISFFFGTSDMPRTLLSGFTDQGFSGLAVVLLIIGAIILLGMVMDSFTIMLVTAGLTAAIVVNLGYDPLWWGVMMIVLVELGVVTPPLGMNLFVLRSIAPDVPLGRIFIGVMPFVMADLVKVGILVAFPVLATWLPGLALN